MELPAGYPESPLEPDEVVFPCKGCGEVRHSPHEPSGAGWSPTIQPPLLTQPVRYRFSKKAKRSN
jgi:hypothetical protein